MRTVSAKFDTYDEVTAAVDGLSDMGVPGSDITVVSRRHDAMTRIAEGVGLGAAVGGIGGLLAGFGMFIISGLGYVSGIGWLIPLLIGAAAGGVAGGVIGSFTGAGIDEKDATICARPGPYCSNAAPSTRTPSVANTPPTAGMVSSPRTFGTRTSAARTCGSPKKGRIATGPSAGTWRKANPA